MKDYISIYRWQGISQDRPYNVQVIRDNQTDLRFTKDFPSLEEARAYARQFNGEGTIESL